MKVIPDSLDLFVCINCLYLDNSSAFGSIERLTIFGKEVISSESIQYSTSPVE